MGFTNLILFQRCFFFVAPPAFIFPTCFFIAQSPSFPSYPFFSACPTLAFFPEPPPHHFPTGSQRHPAMSLLLQLSVLPFLSRMGSPVNMYPFLALLCAILSLIALKLMKWSTRVTSSLPLSLIPTCSPPKYLCSCVLAVPSLRIFIFLVYAIQRLFKYIFHFHLL